MKRIIILCLSAMLLISAPAAAITGNELRKCSEECDKYPNGWSDGFFMGYVTGLQDMWEATTDTANFRKPCIPKDITNGQIFEVVRKYFKNHPEDLDLPADTLVIRAIQDAWPCK